MSIHGHLHAKASAAGALPVCRRTAGIALISPLRMTAISRVPHSVSVAQFFSKRVKFAFALHPDFPQTHNRYPAHHSKKEHPRE
jgi:hypothetical protein